MRDSNTAKKEQNKLLRLSKKAKNSNNTYGSINKNTTHRILDTKKKSR